MSRSNLTLAAAVAAFMAIAPSVHAQGCAIGDDGFDTGCCGIPTTNIPPFPAVTMTANYARFTGCTVSAQNLVNVQISPPIMVLCDFAIIPVSATFLPSSASTGGHTITGNLFAKYARTWLDVAPSGLAGQVWRFLVNGDLQCTPLGTAGPCASNLPACAYATPPLPVHFDGHIDYACDPTSSTNPFNAVISLNHNQGCICHAPWSCVPLSGNVAHNGTSYHLVGPAPFNFGIGLAPQGPLIGDAVRPSMLRLIPAFFYACSTEGKVNTFGSSLTTTSNAGCLCAVGTNICTTGATTCAGQVCYENQTLTGGVCCPPAVSWPFNSVPIAGTPVAATGMIAHNIGTWGGLTRYPWSGHLTSYFSVISYTDPCSAAQWPIHVAVGAGISAVFGVPFSGTPGCGTIASPSTAFIDLQNQLPLVNPSLVPGYGCVSASDMVWNLNTP